MRRSSIFAGAMACAIWMAVAAAQSPVPVHPHDAVVREGHDPVVQVHHEPHHRQIFQRGPMRILDLQIPPGDMSWFHTHDWPVLYVTLSQSQSRTQNLGEDWGGGAGRGAAAGRGTPAGPGAGAAAGPPAGRGGGAPPAGAGGGRGAGAAPRATSTTSYIDRPVVHRLENIGERLFRAMVVVNETHGNDTRTIEAAGFSGTPELTNNWFRAYRIVLGPGESTASHRHQAPAVLFQATAGTALAVGGATFEFNEPGGWAFFDDGDAHEVRNTGSTPIEIIEVEVRRP